MLRLLSQSRRHLQLSRNVRFFSFTSTPRPSITVNGHPYAIPPIGRPVVAICLDGSSQEYIDAATEAGLMPHWNRQLQLIDTSHHNIQGQASAFDSTSASASPSPSTSTSSPTPSPSNPSFHHNRGMTALVSSQMPSYTNPNNVCIMCGVSAAKTGISGNWYWDQATQKEVLMTSPSLLRANSIWGQLSQPQNGNTKVTVVTAKHKLLDLLSHELYITSDGQNSVALSVEKLETSEQQELLKKIPGTANLQLWLSTHRPPPIYSASASIYVLELAYCLMQLDMMTVGRHRPLMYYLSTTDWVQHKYSPGSPEANQFYADLDTILGLFDAAGALIGVTADHGMNEKTRYDGSPRIFFAQSFMQQQGIQGRVILPITDPYVKHHGALGSYATIYLDNPSRDAIPLMNLLRTQCQGVYTALGREDACRAFELPIDRVGDVVIVADRHTVIGTTPEGHDLSELTVTQADGTVVPRPLRSHGGLDETTVPMWFNRGVELDVAQRLTRGKIRNYNLIDILLNGLRKENYR